MTRFILEISLKETDVVNPFYLTFGHGFEPKVASTYESITRPAAITRLAHRKTYAEYDPTYSDRIHS